MAIRNFWIECEIDGRKTKLTGGPQSKIGGFDFVLKMRDEGGITQVLTVEGLAHSDGSLVVEVWGVHDGCNTKLHTIKTKR